MLTLIKDAYHSCKKTTIFGQIKRSVNTPNVLLFNRKNIFANIQKQVVIIRKKVYNVFGCLNYFVIHNNSR